MEGNAEPNLTGMRVLVVEDDNLLAWDTGAALIRAGAEVVGPVSDEGDALEAILRGNLDAAITDINLGLGPSFTTAAALQDSEVPFIFLSGYDENSIPSEFATVPRLLKLIDSAQIVRELAHLLV